MANPQNLRPPFNREEAREYGKKGGEASVRSRREKKTIAQKLDKTLNSPMTNSKVADVLRNNGIPIPKNPTAMDIAIGRRVQKMIENGDLDELIKTAEFIGEKPKEENTEAVKIIVDV